MFRVGLPLNESIFLIGPCKILIALFSKHLAENYKKLLDREQTNCVAFGAVIPPLISFASEVEAKERVTRV